MMSPRWATGVVVAGLAQLAGAHAARAQGTVIIRSTPVQTIWVANGATEYEMDVWADNRGIAPEISSIADWRLVRPAGLEGLITMTRVEWPPAQEDFFAGQPLNPLYFLFTGMNWTTASKAVQEQGLSGGRAGILAKYFFTVAPGFTGQTSFDFDDLYTDIGNSAGSQPREIQNLPFAVIAPVIVVQTVPVQPVWVADGVTEYEMDLYCDNTGLAGTATHGADWQPVPPSGLESYINMTRAEWPATEDFFAGFPMSVLGNLNSPWSQVGEYVSNAGMPGPSNTRGVLARYWFRLALDAPVGAAAFDLNGDNTDFVSQLGQFQPYQTQNLSFNVVAPHGCYANCDGSTLPPVLNVLDFACFLNRYASGDAYANCDGSTLPPVLNVLDFACFLNRYAAGCP